MPTRHADLVLDGGGIKGLALVGALGALEHAGYRFHRVAGTSAGAVVGALAAAGVSADRMARLATDLDYRLLRDQRAWARWGRPGKGLSLLRQLGVYEGAELHRWLRDMLADAGVRTFADLRITDDPGSDLPPERSYRLVVLAADVTRGRLVRLPWDYADYGQDPDTQSVADAVRASCSIPFFYRPATLLDRTTGRPSHLVDAGYTSGIPVDVFDRTDGRPPRWPTFGIKLSSHPRRRRPARSVAGRVAYVQALVGMLNADDHWHAERPGAMARTMWPDIHALRAVDFGVHDDVRQALLDSGRDAAHEFLRDWDFAAYRARHRSAGPTALQVATA